MRAAACLDVGGVRRDGGHHGFEVLPPHVQSHNLLPCSEGGDKRGVLGLTEGARRQAQHQRGAAQRGMWSNPECRVCIAARLQYSSSPACSVAVGTPAGAVRARIQESSVSEKQSSAYLLWPCCIHLPWPIRTHLP